MTPDQAQIASRLTQEIQDLKIQIDLANDPDSVQNGLPRPVYQMTAFCTNYLSPSQRKILINTYESLIRSTIAGKEAELEAL